MSRERTDAVAIIPWWAKEVSNLRPPACKVRPEHSSLTEYSRIVHVVNELGISSFSLPKPISACSGGSCLPGVCQKSRQRWAHVPDRIRQASCQENAIEFLWESPINSSGRPLAEGPPSEWPGATSRQVTPLALIDECAAPGGPLRESRGREQAADAGRSSCCR